MILEMEDVALLRLLNMPDEAAAYTRKRQVLRSLLQARSQLSVRESKPASTKEAAWVAPPCELIQNPHIVFARICMK